VTEEMERGACNWFQRVHDSMMDLGYGMTDPGFGVERAGKAMLVRFSPTTVYYVRGSCRLSSC